MKKILILSANPKNTNKLRLDEEVREIQAGLERARRRDQFEIITRWAVRVDDLRRALLDCEPQIVHFCGHGTGNQGIVLENSTGQMQLVSTQSLAKLFKLFKHSIECVVLNACYSEVQAEAIHQYIGCVMGMNEAIDDRAAIEFAVGFYDALGAGRTYEDAFQFGCSAIDLEGIPDSSTPVLKICQSALNQASGNPKISQPGLKSDEVKDSQTIEASRLQASKKVSHFNLQKPQFAGGLVDALTVQAQQIGGNITNYALLQQQNLGETAAKIQQLLEQLDKSYSTDTTAGRMTVATEAIRCIESDSNLMERILSILKANRIQALAQLLNHPAASFVISALEDWQKIKGG